MVVYEVNLSVSKEIYSEYSAWLPGHLRDMLQFAGFEQAKLWEELPLDANNPLPPDTHKFVVQFTMTDYQHLQDYFQNHAQHARQEAIDKFGNKFSATRRVLNLLRSETP